MIGLVDYIACSPGGCRGEHQSNNPFFILPTTPLHLLPPSLGGARWRMCMCTPCIHTDCSSRSIHTALRPSDGIGPYTVGPNDKATKKVQRTEAFARRCASFFGRGRFSLGSFRPSVRPRPATQQPQNELHKVRIEVRNPIKMLQPYFLFLWKRGRISNFVVCTI